MEKLVYLLGDSEPGSVPRARIDLRERLLGAAPALLAAGARRASFTVADLDYPQADGVAQFNAHGLTDAKIALWLDSLDERRAVEAVIAPLAERFAGYLVTESVPRARASAGRAGGARSPGVCLVTTFDKPASLDDEAFYERWHGSHTPLSLEIHPLTLYVRNSVVRALTPGAPPLRAIVNEAVASVAIAADAEKFYSGDEGRERAIKDLLSFVDFRSLSTALMSEYVLSA